MIVGRAVNGWKDPINIRSELAVSELIKATEHFYGTDDLNWVEEQWGTQPNIIQNNPHFGGLRGQSQGWRLLKQPTPSQII